MKRQNKHAGFTLVEISISLVIFTMVSFFSYQIFRADHKVFVEQEEVVDMQQNARVAMDQLIRDMRLAGAGVPTGGAYSDLGHLHPVIPFNGDNNNPDTVMFLASFENIRTDMNVSMTGKKNAVKVEDAGKFSVGDLALISGITDEGTESSEVFEVTFVDVQGQHRLKHEQSLPWNGNQKLNEIYVIPSRIMQVTWCKYYVDDSDPLHPRLMMSKNAGPAQVVADNIENIQFEYDLSTGEKNQAEPEYPNLIRKGTITLTARADTPDPLMSGGVHSVYGTPDNYRRIELKTDVQIRNLKR